MRKLYVPYVGDGLAASVLTCDRKTIMIDCGSTTSRDLAFRNGLENIYPSVFILSHFHSDHYNGLFGRSIQPHDKPIEAIYFPRVPEFEDRKEFITCLLSLSHYLLGSHGNPMEFDLLNRIRHISSCSHIMSRAVCAGDIIPYNGGAFNVIWPPRTLSDDNTIIKVKKAIDTFHKALEKNKRLQAIFNQLQQTDGFWLEQTDGFWLKQTDDESFSKFYDDALVQPEHDCKSDRSIMDANDALRNVANELSLAFYDYNRFLFMGDLEPEEISKVVSILANCSHVEFYAMLSPHHGTHWHPSLGAMYFQSIVSSFGMRMKKYVRSEFSGVCGGHLQTFPDKSIVIHFPSYSWMCGLL